MTSSLTQDHQPFNPVLNGIMDRSLSLGVDVERFWLNRPSLTHLDLLSPRGSPHLPDEMLLSPAYQGSAPKAFLLSSPEPLLTLLSINQNSQDSPAGAPQTCFTTAVDCKPSPLWHDYYSTGDQCGAQNCNRESDVRATMTQDPYHPSASNKACDGALEEALRIRSLWNISQNAALVDQASRLQRRLLAMLGEHASRHYGRQLEGLRRALLNVDYCPKSPVASGGLSTHATNVMFSDVMIQEDEERISQTRNETLENLAQCGRAVLHGVLEGLDSDATLSSDEEEDREDAKGSSAASQ